MAKELKYLRKFDPNRDASDNWKAADTLSDSWLYGPWELQERFRDAGQNPYLSATLKFEMRLTVREQIAEGEIIAFGIQIAPEPKDEAQQIPVIFFDSKDTAIDWESGEISGLGRKFKDVRICLSGNQSGRSEMPVLAAKPAKRGRKSHASMFEEAFAQLELEHAHFRDWSLEKQAIEIGERTAALHPGRFKGSRPGRSTIYRFLQRRAAGPSIP